MTDFANQMTQHSDLSVADQKKAGQAIGGNMEAKYEEFLTLILDLLERKDIDPNDPQTFLNHKIYDALPQEWKDKTDLMLLNMADQLRLIVDFRLSKQTPDESPHLETMIEHLWHMKERIEGHGYDVFKF